MTRLVLLCGLAAVAGCSTPGAVDAGEDAGVEDSGTADSGTDAGPDIWHCGPATCPIGCCDGDGVCWPGDSTDRCGLRGERCTDCQNTGQGACYYRSCCFAPPVTQTGSIWQTGSCPDAGCGAGTYCLAITDLGSPTRTERGCAPVAAACQGMAPTCACMGCLCGLFDCRDDASGPVCVDTRISRRDAKADISYLSDEQARALARQALDIKLARYRYKFEPPSAPRRLGFIIDDQPDPSPAVMGDRAHVDEYGYTSMLLVLVQEQQRALEALQKRVEQLEREKSVKAPAARAPASPR